MTFKESTFYQSSGVTPSEVYYINTNTRYPFCMNLALLSLMNILHLTENSKCNTKEAYFSVTNVSKCMLILYQNSDLTISKIY